MNTHKIRITLLESTDSTRKNGRCVEEVLQEVEIDADSQREGDEMVEDICSFLEEEYGVEIETEWEAG